MTAHWLDRFFEHALSWPRMFADGWGEQDVLRRVEDEQDPFANRSPIAIDFDEASRAGSIELRQGTYASPAAQDILPQEAHTGHVLWMRPADARDASVPTWVVLASSGEQGFARRRRWLAPLVEAGHGALIVENPYYGLRRPKNQRGSKVRTVADQFVMNATTIREGLGLLDWLRRDGAEHVGITGYSMGGHMAAYAACHDRGPLAVVPAATGLCPAPIYTQGALRRAVAWRQLGDAEASRERLGRLLRRVTDTLPPLSPSSPAILVAARRDGFVFSEQVERLHALWPHSELRWVEGGHVTALVRSSAVIRDAMRDAMAKLMA